VSLRTYGKIRGPDGHMRPKSETHFLRRNVGSSDMRRRAVWSNYYLPPSTVAWARVSRPFRGLASGQIKIDAKETYIPDFTCPGSNRM
jgi:hypothetical protein